jgi:hypothetical protein
MTSVSAQERPPTPPREYHALPAFLSYLVPGLGQIYQGRVAKGILFFVCILTLFYYGMFMGNWSNVYVPTNSPDVRIQKFGFDFGLPRWACNVWARPQFAAQFWVGVAAWPSLLQCASYEPNDELGPIFGSYQRTPYESRSDYPKENENIGTDPAQRRIERETRGLKQNEALRDWPGKTLNELQNEGDKTWDLGWVFTVIAGALNIMVIYDALAGPAFVVAPPAVKEESV